MSRVALKFLSWNVNGVRSSVKKGAFDWILEQKAFVCGLQETKAREDQLESEIASPPGFYACWYPAQRPGYSGTAIIAQEEPISVKLGFEPYFDDEGRCITAEYSQFYFVTVYFPNGGASTERLAYKLAFYNAFLKYANELKSTGKTVIICGDVNTAHMPIDLARPKENEDVSGFLPQERAWIDKFLAAGFIDTFREKHSEGDQYSWWDMKTHARDRNVGWRIDYFFIDKASSRKLKDAFILQDVQGSDHCPVGITMEFDVL
jgi:exodeoxyribonuclease-3